MLDKIRKRKLIETSFAFKGAAIGLGSMIAPVYIAELSPKENRGSLVTFNSAFVTFGILASTLISYGFSFLPADIGWRFMLGFAGLPSVLQFIGFLFMPESPRYLCLKGQDSEALEVLTKIYQDEQRAREEVETIKASFTKDQNKQKEAAIRRRSSAISNARRRSSAISNGRRKSNSISNSVLNGISNGHGYAEKKNGHDANNNGFSVIELHKTNESSNEISNDAIEEYENLNYFGKLWTIMQDPSIRHCLILGICLHLAMQFTGINSIMYEKASSI